MQMKGPSFELVMPDWIDEFLPTPDRVYPTMVERMELAIELARLNVKHGSGGPFGAALFDMETDRLISAGVNLVASLGCSVFHAEIVAITLGQIKVGSYDLGGHGIPPMELVSSTEPCAMCFGSLPWSGIRRLVCGARDGDARGIGFDEGPKLSSWVSALEGRDIEVVRDICRDESVAVLRKYMEDGGLIYNSRQGNI